MTSVRTHIHKNGRIVIPAMYRRAMGLQSGDEVVLILEEQEVRLVQPDQAVKQAQALVRQFVPKNRKLSKELIKDRRQEARRDTHKETRRRKPSS